MHQTLAARQYSADTYIEISTTASKIQIRIDIYNSALSARIRCLGATISRVLVSRGTFVSGSATVLLVVLLYNAQRHALAPRLQPLLLAQLSAGRAAGTRISPSPKHSTYTGRLPVLRFDV
ncbi:hypothetical protein PSPO01_14670 [Paraphaeosphaeria sporulosa]